jgi:hypothetical protein
MTLEIVSGGFVVAVILTIYYKGIRPRRQRTRCPVCGSFVKLRETVHDRSTGEYYHPDCWLEYAKVEVVNEFAKKMKTEQKDLNNF